MTILITGANGQLGNEMRIVAEDSNDKYIFTATGSGHGVGMSQYGAEKMAQDNISYKKILSHYYPGTKLKKAYN